MADNDEGPAKRGRKPKAEASTAGATDATVKKRGRKPTTKVIEFDEGTDFNECIIAHLKLDPTDISKIVCQATDPVALASEASAVQVQQQTAEAINVELDDGEHGVPVDAAASEFDALRREYDALKRKTKHLEDELQAYKEGKHAIAHLPNPFMAKKCVESGAVFHRQGEAPSGGEHRWADRTDIACWWCCHAFEGVPLGIPDSVKDGVFNTFGCFCSLNCALAYNNDMNDYRKHDRQTLIHHIKTLVDPDKKHTLYSAPPRQALKMFGGPLSIDEFRSQQCMVDLETKFKLPPLVSSIGVIEQTMHDIPINQRLRISRMINNQGPIIKRSKPLPNSARGIMGIMKS